MTQSQGDPRIVYPPCFDDQAAADVEQKGWLDAAVVEAPNGQRYFVTFMDLTRARQELDRQVTEGTGVLVELGLLLVPRVSKSVIEHAVKAAWRQGFFNSLIPIAEQST